MRKQIIAVMLSVSMVTAGCTAVRAQGSRVSSQPPVTSGADADLMAHYVRQLPLGSRVRVALADGTVIHGTLMKADADPIVVQRRTRIPERPLEIAIKNVRALEPEKNGSAGRAIAIGAAAGAGAALGVLMILAAIFGD
jgi:hypothetical protein